jgi:hypothetical protein
VKVATWLAPVPAGNLQLDITADGPGAFANVKIAGPNLVTVGATPVPAPTLTSADPSSGVVGTPIMVTGTNLSTPTAVQFGTVAATYTPGSATQLTTVVPNGANGPITVTTAGGISNGLAFALTAGPQQQDGNASLYVEQAGENVSWVNLQYASASGSSISVQYVVSSANSTRAIGPSSAALRGFYEYTVSAAPTDAGLGVNTRIADHDEAVQALYSITSTPQEGFAVRLRDNQAAIYPVAAGDIVRVQIGQSGYSLFINKTLKGSLAAPIEAGNLAMAVQGNGNGTFSTVKIWGPNLVTL